MNKNDSRIALTQQDIMNRYGVRSSVAYRIIREIREFNGGGAIPTKGRVLPFEVEKWEHRNDAGFKTEIQDNK